MNALRQRKDEGEKGFTLGREKKWFHKMRSASTAAVVAPIDPISPGVDSGSEHRRESAPMPLQTTHETPRKQSVSKFSAKLVPKSSSKSSVSPGPKPSVSSLHKNASTPLIYNSRVGSSSSLSLQDGDVTISRSDSTPRAGGGLAGLGANRDGEALAETGVSGAESRMFLDPDASSPRKRSGSRNSAFSRDSRKSGASSTRSGSSSSFLDGGDDALHRKLSKLFFWERTSSTSSTSSHARNKSSVGSIPSTHGRKTGSVGSIPLISQEKPDTVPFPAKRVSSSSAIIHEMPRVIVESPDASAVHRRRRKTEESSNRSRSSSLALSFGRSGSTSTSAGGPLHSSGSVSSMGAGGHRPKTRRSTSSDDVRLRRVLPLPPPPTIGLGAVLDDPHVKELGLDPMAVRYADHMHMLGYTRNRYVCALLARESSKEGSKYNGMVIQAFVMRMLRFHSEPLDMSLRKFLFRMALPQEAQQIERMLHNFSVLWHYQNPGIFADDEQVLYVVFSLVMLHTDVFNKNIKHKISKADYVRNAACDGIAPEIFEYFYDNITATPFRSDEDMAPPSPSSVVPLNSSASSASNGLHSQHTGTLGDQFGPAVAAGLPTDITEEPTSATSGGHDSLMLHEPLPLHALNPSEDSGSLGSRRSSSFTWIRDQPQDPYPFLLENRLDALRPELTSIADTSPFTTVEIQNKEDLRAVQDNLRNDGAMYLQSVSQKSRPDAYITGHTDDVLQAQARPGIVEVQVIKHGVVLRREQKRMVLGGHKPGWREWGVVLTNSRLYLTKNANLVRQLNNKTKASVDLLHSASALSTRDMAALIRSETLTRRDASNEPSLENSVNSVSGNSVGGSNSNDSLQYFMLVEGGRDCAQQCFSVHSESELKSWVQTINAVATQTSLNVRFEPMSGYEQINSAINEVDEQLDAIKSDIATYQRTLKHFRLLAPLHQRTREALVFTAGRYSSKCDDAFAELARLQAYRNILEFAKTAERGNHK